MHCALSWTLESEVGERGSEGCNAALVRLHKRGGPRDWTASLEILAANITCKAKWGRSQAAQCQLSKSKSLRPVACVPSVHQRVEPDCSLTCERERAGCPPVDLLMCERERKRESFFNVVGK